jgi:hypothetical protein
MANRSWCDCLGRQWHPALVALDMKGGYDTIDFSPGTGQVDIIGAYPPSTGLEDSNNGQYGPQNLHPNGGLGSSDIGYALPVETTQNCDLLIAWGMSGFADLTQLHGTLVPTAGPHFTIRESEYGALALEDGVAEVPGLYIGTMSWNDYGHWHMGVAAFKMNTAAPGCKVY